MGTPSIEGSFSAAVSAGLRAQCEEAIAQASGAVVQFSHTVDQIRIGHGHGCSFHRRIFRRLASACSWIRSRLNPFGFDSKHIDEFPHTLSRSAEARENRSPQSLLIILVLVFIIRLDVCSVYSRAYYYYSVCSWYSLLLSCFLFF